MKSFIQSSKDYIGIICRSPSHNINKAEDFLPTSEFVNLEETIHKEVSMFNETLTNIFSNFTWYKLVTFMIETILGKWLCKKYQLY